MVERNNDQISIQRQCQLLSIHRSGLYYRPVGESSLNLHLMRRIDEHFLKYPFKGTRKMTEWLKEEGYSVNRKRVQKLYRLMGLETICPKPDLSKPEAGKYKYPYLLRGRHISRSNEAWAIDISAPRRRNSFYKLCLLIFDRQL